MAKLSGFKTITPTFRANWVFLFKPRPQDEEGKKDQYSITCLFGKDQDLSSLKTALVKAQEEAWGKDKEKWPRNRFSPFKDQGDALRTRKSDNTEYLPDGYVKGAIYMEAKTYNPVQVVSAAKGPDGKLEQIKDETEFYSGCYARASVVFKAYEWKGKKGVTCYLQNVQKVKDGPSLGGRIKAEEEFEAIPGADDDMELTEAEHIPAEDDMLAM